MNIDDLMRELEGDPQYIARKEKLDAALAARVSVLAADEEPILEELRSAGVAVGSLWHLVGPKDPLQPEECAIDYSAAIPVLVRHLGGAYHPRTREGIVRALTGERWQGSNVSFVELFRETAKPEVAAQQIKRAVEMLWEGCAAHCSRDEIEEISKANWASYRFSLANAICACITRESVEAALDLIRSGCETEELRRSFASELYRRVRRWRTLSPVLKQFLADTKY